ncbi:hypothetical protein ACFL00_04195 [Pseudomonadota bacterium]
MIQDKPPPKIQFLPVMTNRRSGMKNTLVFLLILWTLTGPVLASDWSGKTVLVPENVLICDQLYLEKAVALLSAGDKDSVIDYLKQGYCTQSPDPFYAAVDEDTSSDSEFPMVEIVVEGASGWLAKSNADCCYTQENSEWVKEKRPPPAWKKACTPEEALDAFFGISEATGFH